MVVVGIHVGYVVDHGTLLGGGLRVFFAEIPIQRQIVPEAGNELATVELALRTQVAAIQ